MKLALIYNIFEALDLAYLSIKNHIKQTDILILVYQTVGNYGLKNKENYENFLNIVYDLCKENNVKFIAHEYNVNLNLSPFDNELTKRRIGLNIAKQINSTHFLLIDCDEFYIPEALEYAKEEMFAYDFDGMVCGMVGYFKHPTLQFEDTTRVTFIQKITPSVEIRQNRNMQYAFEDGVELIDTKRQTSHNNQFWSNITMHHMSHVRSDLKMKTLNSRAQKSFNQEYYKTYKNAKPGSFLTLEYCRIKNKPLKEVENIFNIPIDKFIDQKII